MKCKCECGKMAVWSHGPSEMVACDDCVPRGCSCNDTLRDDIDWESPLAALPENWITPLDEKGRKYPCCEWQFEPNGIEIN